jgi:Secretion system C-terminal sorting domain/PA domain
MKQFSILFVGLLLQFFAQAQTGTENSGLVLRVTINGVSTDYNQGDCGYGTADWGGVLNNSICAPAQWARDVVGADSLVCDSIPAGSLTGKVALVRRGACAAPNAASGNFSAKVLNAQKGGAVAVLLANHSAIAGQTDCYSQAMPGGTASVSGQVTVPALFICREIATKIDNAFKANQPVEVCLYRPDVFVNSAFYPVSSGQTPVSQIAKDTFGFSMRITNTRGVDLSNVALEASVQTTAGVELFSTSIDVPLLTSDVSDSLFVFPDLFAPELGVGTYRIVYSTKADAVAGLQIAGSRQYNFNVTDRLWSKDVSGAQIGFRPGTIPDDGWGVANVYQLIGGSQENYVIKTIEFSHSSNATEIPITEVKAAAYFLEVDDDLVAPNYDGFDDADFVSSSFKFLGTGDYQATAASTNFQIQQLPITNIEDPNIEGVPVVNGKRYFISMFYADASRNVFHSFNEDYMIPGIGTATYSTNWFLGGFTGDPTAVLRAYLDLGSTTDEKPLPDASMRILPNPIQETLNLGLTFEQATEVTITIAELSGRVIRYEDRNVTEEVVSYQVPELASGTYLARIATKEGTLTKKFMVVK